MNGEKKIPESTIETLARSIYREAATYGFRQADYLRLVNFLLDITMQNGRNNGKTAQRTPGQENRSKEEFLKNARYDKFPLMSSRVKIRLFENSDDEKVLRRWIEDEHGRYFLLSRISARTLDLKQIIGSESNILGIITLHDDTPVGAVAYLDYDRSQKKAELRKLIGEERMRGKGYAKEASLLWIKYGLTILGLKKIYLNTLNTNLRNIKLNEELGFKVEGILRNEVFFDGQHHDVLRMGLIVE